MASSDETASQAIPPSSEEKPLQNPLMKIKHHPFFLRGVIILLAISGILGFIVWNDIQSTVYIEDSTITAPVITIS
ncbi:MAG: hypothetical protein LUQ50_05000, partial [Methanospirillum sp.]|uniref:hypothetical protein n=1 Tax=Methanospirillum sp. TaxID=45200 RepID=UPI002369D88B